jgi:hypothetical protein
VLGLALAGAPPAALAAQWSFVPTFAFLIDHDSNRFLVPDGTPSDGASMSVDAQLQYATDRLTVALHPQALLQRYDSRIFPNTNDVSLGGNVNWLTERSSFAFNGLVSELSLLTTELPVTGIVEPGTRVRNENAAGSWTYAETETRSLTLQASSVDAVYQSQSGLIPGTPLLSYRGTTLSATQQFQHSERLGLFATLSIGSFDEQGLLATVRTDGLVMGLKSQLSERTTLSVDAGVSRTTYLSLVSEGFLGDLTLTRSTETGSLTLSASRNVQPAGFGEITQQDTIKLAAHRDLSERLGADANLSFNRYSSVFDIPGLISIDLPYLDRSFAQLGLGLTWHQTETWSLASWAYENRAEANTVPTADGWQVQVSAVWTPRGRSVSR